MCVLFFLQVLPETLPILSRIVRDIIINVNVFMLRARYCFRIFETYSSTKFHENPSSGSPAVPCGRHIDADRHDKTDSPFSQFSERT
jgi:hypothetical protein